jgi:Tfp pilus assembly protein FimT
MGNKGIELIVVMAIIGIGALLVAPSIGSWGLHYRLNSQTKDIASTMRLAQMKAISNNAEYRVSFNVAGNWYVLQHNSGGNWINEGININLPKTITFVNASFGGESFAKFNPNSTSSVGSVTLRNQKGMQKRISLISNGRIRTVD